MKIAEGNLLAWRLREGAAAMTWFGVVYVGSDWLTDLRATENDLPSLVTAADTHIPFWPQAAWIYMTVMPVVLLSIFVLRERSEIRALSLAISIEIALAGLIYLLLPVTPMRTPDADLPAIFRFADDLNLTYNSFPSLHVALSVTAAAAMMVPRHIARNTTLMLWAAAIAISTLLTHQHSIADVAGGVVLAGLGVIVFSILRPRLTTPQVAL